MTDATTIVPEIEPQAARHRIKATAQLLFLSARGKPDAERNLRRSIAGNLYIAALEPDPEHAPIWTLIADQLKRLEEA